MIKHYLGDGFIQIAILLSLLRTDLNNLTVPNNEILSYPEVQDILQGQTLAILPTSFHNQYNSLHSSHGVHNSKLIEGYMDNVYFSSLFSNWRFRRLTTNIEAFLVRCDESVGFPPVQQPPAQSDVNPQPDHAEVLDADAENNNNAVADSATASIEPLQVTAPVDASGSSDDVDSDFNHPFPGLSLSKEDLDLIEVLWRQDVDLGVGKEVFDPNLRKEIEQERELELRKEQEKRKEAERREQERQQQAQQWLLQNFIRDGETGELMPIAGNSSSFASSGNNTSNTYSNLNFQSALEEALSFVGELQVNHTYGQQPPQQQPPPVATVGPQCSQQLPSYDAEGLQYLEENFINEVCGGYNYTTTNQTDQERLEQSWKEVVESIFTEDGNTTTPNTTTAATIATPPPNSLDTSGSLAPSMEEPHPMPPLSAVDSTYLSQLHLCGPNVDFLTQTNHSLSQSASMSATRRLLHQNSTDLSELAGLLQNATMPFIDMQHLLPSDTDVVSPDYSVGQQHVSSSSISPQDLLPSLDLEGADLLFSGSGDLSNMTGAMMGHADLLNASDLLSSILPVAELDMTMDEAGLDSIHMLDETGSDSAISMGSGSPQQEINETMEMSPFDGLEGATGGSDYDNGTTNSYGHHRSHVHSSGSIEEENYQYSCSSYGSPASVSTNCSTGSNDTEHSSGQSSTTPATLHHLHHNHTYPTQPGQTPREVKKYAKKDGSRQKGPQSRDNKRAEDLKLPFTFDQIVNTPVEEFNEILTKTKLSEAQMNLMRDIRRRGKNKVAAQNCRKRKLDVLVTLEEEMEDMQRMRDKLAEERHHIEQQTREVKDRYAALYDHIFACLRDDQGRPYSPTEFSLQQSSDGNVFLVRKVTGSATSLSSASSSSGYFSGQGSSSSSSSSSGSSSSKRGKDCDPQKDPSSSLPTQKKKSRE